MNCKKARSLSIISTLKKIGYSPTKETERDAWYLSPLRNEKDASFKVCKRKNLWYDFGLGKGGNNLDLIIEMKGSVQNALSFLKMEIDSFSFHQQPILPEKQESKNSITAVKDIQNFRLISYLYSRGIPIYTARQICKEVHYTNKGKNFYSIGLQNISGGWDLRNKYHKNASSPKDISLIKKRCATLIITEGMFDMLSLLVAYPNLSSRADLLILNSISLAKKASIFLPEYHSVELCLDRDLGGQKTTEYFLNASNNCIDKSSLYDKYKDPNDWLVNKSEISV